MVATRMSAGGLAILSYATDDGFNGNGDVIRFTLLEPIGAGTQIFFTDRAWTPSNGSVAGDLGNFAAAASGEDTFTYTAGADIPAGTVITITAAQLAAAGVNLAHTGETIYAYQGTEDEPTNFLFAADIGDGNTTFNGSLVNTGLVNGVNAVAIAHDQAVYQGQGTGVANTQLADIANNSRWYGNDTDDLSANLYDDRIFHDRSGPTNAGDMHLFGAMTGGGQADAIVRVDNDEASNVGTNLTRLLRDHPSFISMEDIAFDVENNTWFAVMNEGTDITRIVKGSISDLYNVNQSASFTTIYEYNNNSADSNDDKFIQGIEIDKVNDRIYFTLGDILNGHNFMSVDYNGGNQRDFGPIDMAQDNLVGFNGGIEDFVIDTVNNTAYFTYALVQVGSPSVVHHNYLVKLTAPLNQPAPNPAVENYSIINLGMPADGSLDAGRLDPAQGSVRGIDIDTATNTLWFVTGRVNATGTGGVFKYNLNTSTLTEVWEQPSNAAHNTPQAFPTTLLHDIEVDSIGGRYYITDQSSTDHAFDGTPGTDENGGNIWSGSLLALPGTAPTLFADNFDPNGGAVKGMEINYAPTALAAIDANAAVIEASSSSNSGETSQVQVITGITLNDVDTTSLQGAAVSVSSGFMSGSTQDYLRIGGNTSGTVSGIAYSYNIATGVMTFTGNASYATYQSVLAMVTFSTSGDNVTNYGQFNGRTISFSVHDGLSWSDPATATVDVTGINDAPVNTVGAAMNFTEDTNGSNSGTPPVNAVTGISVADVDADPANEEITVTLSVENGGLNIRSDVVGGITSGDVLAQDTDSDGLQDTLVITATQNQINNTLAAVNASNLPNGLVYTPKDDFNGADTLTITTNDQGNNGNDPGLTGTGTNEADIDEKMLNVADVNDAPTVVDGTQIATEILEDQPLANGQLVSDLFGASFADTTDVQYDADTNPTGSTGDTLAGIAIIANGSNANGQWQYWDGDSWENIGAASADLAKTFTAATQLRFNPAADYNGAAPTLTAHLIESGGPAIVNGGTVDLNPAPLADSDSVYTAGTVTLSQAVTAVNDSPVVVGGTAEALVAIQEDDTGPAGETVTSLFASHFDDSKDDVGATTANTFVGVAITANPATASQGTWQVFTGGSWIDLPTVSAANAVFVAASDSLRFVPAADFNGAAPQLTVHLVEDSNGTPATGDDLDLTTTGGSTPFSQAMTLGQNVDAVNDAPSLTPGSDVTVDEDSGAYSAAWATDIVAGPANESSQGLTITTTVLSSDFNFSSVPSVNVVTGNLAFTAAANESGTASIQVVITDDGGTPANLADDLSETHTFTITIDPVNDAPVNNVGGTANAAEDGPAVALTGISISDVDADPATDVVTVTLSVGNGTLTIADNVASGLAAADIAGQGTDELVLTGTLNQINATLAAANALMYTPNPDFYGSDGLTVTTNDGGATGGAAEEDVDVKAIDVAAVNDAPTLANDMDLAGTDEDTANTSQSVASILSDAGYDDSDGPSAGMAVTGLTGNGTWEYSTDGGTSWHAVGAVSDGAALLLSGTSELRYVPDGDNGETATVSFRGWDGTTGSPTAGATRSTGDTTTNGGATGFSTAEQTGTLTVTDVNDAPSIGGDGTEVLAAVDEDAADPAGETVQNLFAGQFADVDTGDAFAGVAVIGATVPAADGEWQYFDGTDWVSLAAASPTDAILLATDAMVRFLPALDFNGAVPSLEVRLVDDSGGALTTGATVDLDALGTGGTTRVDDQSVVLGTTVNPVNDAPDAGTGVDLAAIDEDTASPAGETVSSLFGGLFPDADNDGLAGIAVVDNAATSAEGVWQYHDGVGWVDIAAPSESSALVLGGATLVRFVPAADFNGAVPELSVHLIDDSAGAVTTGDTVDVSTNGGTTPYSDNAVGIGQDVTSVNDRPTLQLSSVGPSATLDYSEDEGAQTIAPTADLGDVDSDDFGGGSLIVSFDANGEATDQLGIKDNGSGAGAIGLDGSNVTYGGVVIGTVSGGANGTDLEIQLDSDATVDAVEALIQNVTYDTSSDQPSTLPRTVHYEVRDGDGGDEMAQGNAVVNVTIANDAPTVDAPAGHAGDEDAPVVFTGATAITIDDADLGAGLVSVVLQVADGTLTLGSTAGLAAQGGNGSATVSLAGTLAAVNNALDGLTYQGSLHSNGDRTLTINVSDNGFTGHNLIVNPGAEIGPSAGDYATSELPFGWTLVGGSGGMTAVQYAIGDSDALNTADSTAVGGGDDYFAGGPGGAASSISQVIDVSAHAAKIDASTMLANFSGFFGGYLAQEDAMTMTVRFLDENGTVLGSETIGGASADDRGDESQLLPDASVANLPPLTRSIEVVLTSVHSLGSYTDGYADNLSLTLSELVGETVVIDLDAVNDPVSISVGAAANVAEEGTVAITALTINDVDAALAPDGEYTVTLAAADGTLTLGTLTGLAFTDGDGSGDATMTFKGTLDEVNAALGSLSFTGATDFFGLTDIDVSVSDATAGGASTGSGAATTDAESVEVTVTNVNDAPVLDLNGAAAGNGAVLGYTENGAPAAIAPDATVTDVDNGNFDGGSLTVDVTSNGDADDRLSLVGGGGITVVAGVVSHLGTEIGSVSGGSGPSDPLLITFNAAANEAAVEAVLQRVSYHNVSDDPSVLARTITYTLVDGDGGVDTGTAIATVNLTAVDDPATPGNDSVTTTEAASVTGNVVTNDGDIDSTPTVATVNGAAADGTPVALASGALVTMNADGTFEYDPNGAFDHLAQTGLGAFNDQAVDSFTYTLSDGTSATVSVTVDGLFSNPHRMAGTSGGDVITGTGGAEIFQLWLGGNDQASGLGGKDLFQLGGAFTRDDRLDGGDGNDIAFLSGDYATEVEFDSQTMRNIEAVLLAAGYDYTLTSAQETVANGATLVVDGSKLGAADALVFDGSAETDGRFRLTGGQGDDALTGGLQDDVLIGRGGTNMLAGGGGNDIYVSSSATDQIVEAQDQGIDTVRASADRVLGDHIENLFLSGAAREGTGNGLDNLITGTTAADTLSGAGGDDRLVGLGGIDVLSGGEGEDVLAGAAGSDVLNGEAGDDRLFGGTSGDTLNGGLDKDLLIGGDGADILNGGDDLDALFGQGGRDILTGGLGKDFFLFRTGEVGASLAEADRITDFDQAEEDRIHLADLDAVEGTPATEAFTFIGNGTFSGTGGELRYSSFGGNTYLQGDTDGDGGADFFIRIDGVVALTAGDLIL